MIQSLGCFFTVISNTDRWCVHLTLFGVNNRYYLSMIKIIVTIPVSAKTQEDTLDISALNVVFFSKCVPFHSLSDVSSPLNIGNEGIPNVLLCSIPIDPLPVLDRLLVRTPLKTEVLLALSSLLQFLGFL